MNRLLVLVIAGLTLGFPTQPPGPIPQSAGVKQPYRPYVNYGTGITFTDDPSNNRYTLTVAGGGTVTADSPLGGDGSSGNHLTCVLCLTGSPSATGDIMYSTSGGRALSSLADVAVNNVLISGGVGVAPSWGKVGNSALTNSSLTVATTSPLGGGGSVALGATLTLTCTTCVTTSGATFTGSITVPQVITSSATPSCVKGSGVATGSCSVVGTNQDGIVTFVVTTANAADDNVGTVSFSGGLTCANGVVPTLYQHDSATAAGIDQFVANVVEYADSGATSSWKWHQKNNSSGNMVTGTFVFNYHIGCF